MTQERLNKGDPKILVCKKYTSFFGIFYYGEKDAKIGGF